MEHRISRAKKGMGRNDIRIANACFLSILGWELLVILGTLAAVDTPRFSFPARENREKRSAMHLRKPSCIWTRFKASCSSGSFGFKTPLHQSSQKSPFAERCRYRAYGHMHVFKGHFILTGTFHTPIHGDVCDVQHGVVVQARQ
jgi:hypothetical protein